MAGRRTGSSPAPGTNYRDGVMYIVYAIKSCTHNYIYVGQTKNLEERLNRHNKGYERTTRYYRPYKLIFTEECIDRIDARKREKYWKSGVGKSKLRKKAELVDLPTCQNEISV